MNKEWLEESRTALARAQVYNFKTARISTHALRQLIQQAERVQELEEALEDGE